MDRESRLGFVGRAPGESGFVASHPCANKKAQRWGTELCGVDGAADLGSCGRVPGELGFVVSQVSKIETWGTRRVCGELSKAKSSTTADPSTSLRKTALEGARGCGEGTWSPTLNMVSLCLGWGTQVRAQVVVRPWLRGPWARSGAGCCGGLRRCVRGRRGEFRRRGSSWRAGPESCAAGRA